MAYKLEDMYKETVSHCHDCKEDISATIVPMLDDMKIEGTKTDFPELQVDISIPVKLQCPLCSGFNVGDVIIKVTIDKDGVKV